MTAAERTDRTEGAVIGLWAERRVPGPAGRGTVLIADDDGFSAEALADMLQDEGFPVVGVAIDGAQAVDAVQRLDPDVVLMDLRMPVMDGAEATRLINAERSRVPVVMLSACDEGILRDEALRCGAYRYLVKGCGPDVLFATIRDATARRVELERRPVASA
jgi:DNA-binding NarL/FixJ family response regulator